MKQFLRHFCVILMLFVMGSGTLWADEEDNPTTYRIAAGARAVGAGKVYVSGTSSYVPDDNEWKEETDPQIFDSPINSITVYFLAKPDEGADFLGWYAEWGCTTKLSDALVYEASLSGSSGSGMPDACTYYAKFCTHKDADGNPTTESVQHAATCAEPAHTSVNCTQCGKTLNIIPSEDTSVLDHTIKDNDRRNPCSVCNHGFFRYHAPAKLSDDKLSGKIVDAKGNTYSAEKHSYDDVTEEGMIEFDAPVAEIKQNAFNKSSISGELLIPYTVTKIGDYAFEKCTGITGDLYLHNVTVLGEWAFSDCSGFNGTVRLPKIKELNGHAFESCNITDVEISSDSLITIGSSVFFKCNNLKSLKLHSIPEVAGYSSFPNDNRDFKIEIALDEKSIIRFENEEHEENKKYLNPYLSEISVIKDSIAHWGTAIYPFPVVSNDTLQYYELQSVENHEMRFAPVEAVEASTPCVYKYKGTGSQLKIVPNLPENSNPAIDFGLVDTDYKTIQIWNNEIKWYIVGTLDKNTISHSNGYYLANDKFWSVNGDRIVIPTFCCFFLDESTSSDSAPRNSYDISEAGEENALRFVEEEDGSVRCYYDLMGRRVSEDYRGLKVTR